MIFRLIISTYYSKSFLYVSGGNLLKRPPRKTLKRLVSDTKTCSCLKTKFVQSLWPPNVNSKGECDIFKHRVENDWSWTFETKQIDWNRSLSRIKQHVWFRSITISESKSVSAQIIRTLRLTKWNSFCVTRFAIFYIKKDKSLISRAL